MTDTTAKAPKAPKTNPLAMEIVEGAGPQMLTDMSQVQGQNPERDAEVVETAQHDQPLTVVRY